MKSLSITLAATACTCSIALAELPGLPAPAEPQPASTIRPSDKPEKTIVVQQTGPIRGSLYKAASRVAVPVGPDGDQVGPSPLDLTAVSEAKPKKFQKNDVLTIIVSESSVTSVDSKSKNEKKSDMDMALQQFVQLSHSASGLPTVGVVGSPSKLPEVKWHYDNNRDNTASQQRSDTFNDRFSATVVDVKPNGTMVIEAVRKITVDKEVQEYKMSGICRVLDVTAENTVMSTQLANLNLNKQTSGEVRNGMKSGWLNNLIDKFNPF